MRPEDFSAQDNSKVRSVFKKISEEHCALTSAQIEKLLAQDAELIVVSRVLNIFRALRTMFIDTNQADFWNHRPNAYFEGKTTLDVMTSDQHGLQKVQRYFQAQLL